MTTEYIYNPAAKSTVFDRFADFCRDAWGVNAPEFVTMMVGALLIGIGLGVVLASM